MGKVKFWDVTKAIFYATKDYTYLRLADKSNPNNHTVRGSFYIPGYWSQDTFVIQDKSYITIKDINFRTYNNAISVRGASSHDINITNNNIQAFKIGIEIQSNAHDVNIFNNEIPFAHLGTSFGSWIGSEYISGNQKYSLDLKQAIYQWYHHWIFNGTGFTGISASALAGDNIDIYNNRISQGFIAIDITASKNNMNNVKVHSNTINNFSSGAIYARGALINLQIYNNVMSDVNYAVRNHELDMSSTRKVYIYNNWVSNPDHIGMGIFFHYFSGHPIPANPPEIYIYHNNFIGGRNGLNFDAYVSEYGGAKGVIVLNNIISSGDYDLTGANTPEKDFFGAFDYNWLDNMHETYTKRNWFGSNNIRRGNSDSRIIDINTQPGTKLPSNSRANEAGIDLSKTQIVNGRSIGPLPGMTSQYYSGKAPTVGVVSDLSGGNIIVSRTAINGKCSTVVNQCSSGVFIDNTDTSSQSKWICAGIDGGSADYCSINKSNSGGNDSTGGGGGSGAGGTNSGNNNGNNNNTQNNNNSEQKTVANNNNNVITENRVTVNTPTTVTSSAIRNTIKLGSKGDEVKIVQSYLIEKGYLKITNPTGYYGTITQKAVGIYQIEKGIISSAGTPGYGQVGPKTRTELNKDLTGKSSIVPSTNNSASIPQTAIQNTTTVNTPTVTTSSGSVSITKNLSIGSKGEEVKSLQSVLVEQNLIPSKYITGYYGKITETAVKSLQTKYNIVSSGTPYTTGYGAVGPKTRKVINGL